MEMGEHSLSYGESADLPHTWYERLLSHHSVWSMRAPYGASHVVKPGELW